MALTEDPLWASTQSAIWGTAEAVGHPARRAAVAEVDPTRPLPALQSARRVEYDATPDWNLGVPDTAP